MKEQTGATYQSAPYAKMLAVSEAKVGKTTYLAAAALGALPWQKSGGIVDKPENLHIMTFDANAAGGLRRFLTETCGCKDDVLGFNVLNLQDDLRKTSESDSEYDMTFYNTVCVAIDKARQRAKGVPVFLISSLTGLAYGLERSLVGPPTGKGYSDQSKWKALAHQLNEIRNYCQVDVWHCIWEAHIDKPAATGQGGVAVKEGIRVSGEAGRNWAYNVEQVFRIRREFNTPYNNTKCDKVYLDTRAAMDFIANGRNFTECLEAKEYDPALALHKLGIPIGGYTPPRK